MGGMLLVQWCHKRVLNCLKMTWLRSKANRRGRCHVALSIRHALQADHRRPAATFLIRRFQGLERALGAWRMEEEGGGGSADRSIAKVAATVSAQSSRLRSVGELSSYTATCEAWPAGAVGSRPHTHTHTRTHTLPLTVNRALVWLPPQPLLTWERHPEGLDDRSHCVGERAAAG